MKKILFLCLLCLLAASCRQPSEKGRVAGEGEVEDSAL